MSTSLMPSPLMRFYKNDGKPAEGCFLHTFEAGTNTPKAAFQDAAGIIPHMNPIPLNAKGEALVYWDGNYKVDLRTAAGVSITGYPVDNFASIPQQIYAALAGPGGAALIGYQAGTVADTLANIDGNLNFNNLPPATFPANDADLMIIRQGPDNKRVTMAAIRADFAAGAAVQAALANTARIAAEAARDAALIQAGIYATEALGRAAVANGEYFKVIGSRDVAAYEYLRVDAATSTLIASYPSVNAVRMGQMALDALAFSANLYDLTLGAFEQIIDAAGALTPFPTFETTGYITIKPGELYTASMALFSLAYYDTDGAFMGPLVVCAPATTTFTPPVGAYSVRVTFESGSLGANRQTLMIVEGAALPGVYTPYTSSVMPMSQFAAFDDRSAEYRVTDTNLFDPDRATLNETISGVTGATAPTASAFFVSGWIPVVGGRTYRVSHACYDYAVFDVNRRYITGDESGWGSGTTRTMPPGACWLRVDSLHVFRDRLHISAGAGAPATYRRFDGVPGPLVGKGIGFRGDSIWNANKIQPLVCKLVGGALEFNTCGDGTTVAWNLASITAPALVDTDIIIMEHGINDWKNSAVLGTLADASNATGSFYARLKAEFDAVYTAKPTIRVIRTTPTKTFTGLPFNFAQWDVPNGVGLVQADYVQAIKEVSEIYSVPVLDLYAMSNVNAATETTLLYDHLHWEDALYDRIAVQVARFAESNF